MISPYQADKDNLGWSTTGAQAEGVWGAGAETLVANASDSLFAGVPVTGGYADLINDTISYSANDASAFVSVVGSTDDGKLVLARIAEGSAWNETTHSSSGTHGGNRIVFQYAIEPSLISNDLTADGLIVLENAITELLPELTLAPARIEGGMMVLSNRVIRLAISGASPSALFCPVSTVDLVNGTWGRIPHSDDGVNPFIETNLTYSTTDGTHKFIYIRQGTNSAGFIRIQSVD